MKKYIAFIILILSIAVISCDEKEEFEQINSKAVDAAGEWWIKFTKPGYETGYIKVLTFNTSADLETEIWIYDRGSWMDMKVKCPVDLNNLTFSGQGLSNIQSDNTVTISEGKITLEGGTSTSGLVTDAISFKIEMSDEPGVVYTATGHRKTGYIEDEH